MQVEPVRREIIEDKLLVALDDESKVAILLGEQDLSTLIVALQAVPTWNAHYEKAKRLAADAQALRTAAFKG